MTPDCTIIVRKADELLAVIPYVLGFHPSDSLVVVGLAGGRLVTFGLRLDLDPPIEPPDAARFAAVVAKQPSDAVTLVGYGPPGRVTPAVMRLLDALKESGVLVLEALRVTDGRWWSYLCESSRCCPDDGTPCPPPGNALAAQEVFRGRVALPDRQALVAQVAAVTGAARERMAAATAGVRQRLIDLYGEDVRAGAHGRFVRRAGRIAVRNAEQRHRAGRPLTDDEVAWLGVLLVDGVVFDYALDRSTGDEWRIRLWTDVLRRVEAAYVPAPACLLALAAWQDGQGALARVAVQRALAEAREHRMAGLLDRLLLSGFGPQAVGSLSPPNKQRTRSS
jgi:hypothetical protein